MDDSKALITLLTWECKDRWFNQVFDYAEGEGKEYVLQKTLEEYCHVSVEDYNNEGTPVYGNKPVRDNAGNVIPNRFKAAYYVLQDKKAEYKKDNAWLKARVNKHLSDTDLELVALHSSMKDRMNALRTKYFRQNAAAGARQIAKVTSFTLDISKSIDENWAAIRRENREAARFLQGVVFPDALLFTFMQNGMPQQFHRTIESLNTHTHLSVSEKLEILQDFWLGLSPTERSETVAHIAAENAYISQGGSGDEGGWVRGKCFQCLSGEHGARVCPYKKKGQRYMQELRLADERKHGKEAENDSSDEKRTSSSTSNWRSRSRTRGDSRDRDSSRDRSSSRGRKYPNSKLKKAAKAFIAAVCSDTDFATDFDEDDDDSALEISHMSAENRKDPSTKTGGR